MVAVPAVRNDMPRLTYLTYCHAYKGMRVGRLIGALRRLTSKMAAIGKADWQIHDWRGELIDRRLDYYTKDTKSTKGSIDKLRALRDLRGFKILTDETSDRQNFVAASIAYRLYSKLCSRVQENIGNNWMHPSRKRCSFSMVGQSLAAG